MYLKCAAQFGRSFAHGGEADPSLVGSGQAGTVIPDFQTETVID
jgi:hypothetical protein